MNANKIFTICIISIMIVSALGITGLGPLISGIFTQSYSSGDDTYEENDNSGSAATLAVGTYTGLQCLDDDWYRIRLTAGTDITVTMDLNNSNGDLDLELYSTDASTIISSSQSDTDREMVSVSSVSPPGFYYIRVYGYRAANNSYDLTLSTGDITPPVISNVNVIWVSDTSALLGWTTDEPTTSELSYGNAAGSFPDSVTNARYTLNHSVNLSGLESYTTYNYMVVCTDRVGNSAEIGPNYFRTKAPADTVAPVVELMVPATISGMTEVRVRVTDDTGVAKVEFYLDGRLQHTDYSDDPRWKFDSGELADGRHVIIAKATDKAGNTGKAEELITIANPVPDRTPPEVNILTTFKRDTVRGGNVNLELTSIDPDSGVDRIVFYVDGEHKATNIAGGEAGDTIDTAFNWNTYGATNNEWHTLSVEVFNEDGLSAVDSMDVFVDNPTDALPSGQGDLEIRPIDLTREKVRYDGTWYEVVLYIKNVGNKEINDISVWDYHHGFQAVSTDYGSKPDVHYNPTTRDSEVRFSIASLQAGEQKTLTVNMVPILYAPDPRIDYAIGTKTFVTFTEKISPTQFNMITLNFYIQAVQMETWSGSYQLPIHWLYILSPMETRDYLIVTHPANLYALYNIYEAGLLLSDIAEFSRYKNAVLGYMETSNVITADRLKEAITPNIVTSVTGKFLNGGWNAFLTPDWENNGYLLIVGETEIIPGVFYIATIWNPDQQKNIAHEIPLSDHFYADLLGDGGPDVTVGRIIGDSPAALRKPLKTSLGVHNKVFGYDFDGSDALLVSGIGNYYPGFVEQVNTIGNRLDSIGVDALRQHWAGYVIMDDFQHTYDSSDDLAVGDFGFLPDDEIVIADSSADRIKMFLKDGTFLNEFYHDFDPDDSMVVGDVTGDDRDEIIITDISADMIYVYRCQYSFSFNGAVWTKGLIASASIELGDDDDIATGDVWGDGKDDIVISDESDEWLRIKFFIGTTFAGKNTDLSIPNHHQLGIGDLISGGKEEIIVAEEELFGFQGKFNIYDANGNKLAFFYGNIEEDDSLDTGNVWGDAADDIIVKSSDDDRFYYYFDDDETTWYYPKEEWNNIYLPLSYADDIAAGQVFTAEGGADEIVVADSSADKIYYFNNEWHYRFNKAFRDHSGGKDIIYWGGHGGPNTWGAGVQPWTIPADFGGTNPFVLAPSCNTGQYEWTDDDNNFHDDGIAEAFFNSGAGAYIGATRMTNTGTNKQAGILYFNNYWDPNIPVGKTYTELERYEWTTLPQSSSKLWWREVLSYNIYGDPKYKTEENGNLVIKPGAIKNTNFLKIITGPGGASADFGMKVPAYNLTTNEGVDYVDIAGGNLLLNRDHYRVPIYTESITIPEGYRVQDVELVNRSSLSTARGLNLSRVIMEDVISGEPFGDPPGPHVEAGREWYPYDEYRWNIVEHPNGTSTLYITAYPFYHNQKTGESRYYQDYEFNIDYIQSEVGISSVLMERPIYEMGEDVSVEISLTNRGASVKTVILSAELESYVDTRYFIGSQLQTLDLNPGRSRTVVVFDTGGLEANHYEIRVNVMDLSGNSLGSQYTSFKLGSSAGIITGLSTSSTFYEDGNPIFVDFDFSNTGTIALNGTALVTIKNAEGNVVAEFQDNFSGLSPLDSAGFESTWDTTGAVGRYFVTASVYYDGKWAISEEVELNDYGSAVEGIIEDVSELELPHGLRNSLQSKLDNAIKLIELGKYNAASNLLEAFINEVEAHRGKIFTDAETDMLVDNAREIIDGLK